MFSAHRRRLPLRQEDRQHVVGAKDLHWMVLEDVSPQVRARRAGEGPMTTESVEEFLHGIARRDGLPAGERYGRLNAELNGRPLP